MAIGRYGHSITFIEPMKDVSIKVLDDGIYRNTSISENISHNQLIISKTAFIDAFKQYILPDLKDMLSE